MSNRAAALLALAVVALDRITKVIVLQQMRIGETNPIVPGFFSLTHVRNRGAAFGLLADAGAFRDAFLIFVAVAAVGALSWLLVHMETDRLWERAGAAAVIGGALGNLYDRLAYGSVVDFLDVYYRQWHWPAFNVADSAITVGVIVLLLASFSGDQDVSVGVKREEPPGAR